MTEEGNNGRSNTTQERQKDIYIGNGKEKERKTGEKFLVCSICMEDIKDIPEEHIKVGSNGKHYVQIVINRKRDGEDKWGNTHSVKVDTFKPSDLNDNYTEKENNGNR